MSVLNLKFQMKTETKNLTRELNDGLISVQKDYERRHAQLEENISELDKQHAEWMKSNDGEKLLRLKLAAAFKENGESESVYSERVKSKVNDISAEIQKNGEAAMERLKARFGNTETSSERKQD